MKYNEDYYTPTLSATACPEMTDRELLGYPEHFTPLREFVFNEEIRSLLKDKTPQQLAEILESKDAAIDVRYFAGQHLCYQGDSRLDTFNPEMCDVPGGKVSVGLDEQQVDQVMDDCEHLKLERIWIEKETPRHSISLRDFRIGKYPITNQEYKAFLCDTEEQRIPKHWFLGRYPQECANHPVTGISVEDTESYIQWLNRKTGREFRLPTEFEWEYAAAGPNNYQYPWGNEFLADHCNTAEFGVLTTTPVGLFSHAASPFGCMDMAGNVEEFVADDYAPYPGADFIEDDLVTKLGCHRIARGGSFSRFRDLTRNTRRHGAFPRDIYVMGFRLAEDA
ncbi:SUMF1/EgtB/PvdO family nonheme iron enzyme [Vibrio neptunius]|uniref:formylglycine-generating enzyme family protein n=1 Tax=Vibrio neptunius TaxID=170651 RepID=UPI0033161E76